MVGSSQGFRVVGGRAVNAMLGQLAERGTESGSSPSTRGSRQPVDVHSRRGVRTVESSTLEGVRCGGNADGGGEHSPDRLRLAEPGGEVGTSRGGCCERLREIGAYQGPDLTHTRFRCEAFLPVGVLLSIGEGHGRGRGLVARSHLEK